MIRGLLAILVVFVALFAVAWFVDRYMKMRTREKKLVEAYFTGGPLNGYTRKLEQLAPEYMYSYNKAALVTEKDQSAKVQHAHYTAVYALQGDDMYAYTGSINHATNQLEKEETT
jgi:hypothetical protein